jgi:transposase
MSKYYLGIDIGKYHHMACLTDESGNLLEEPFTFAVTPLGFQTLLQKIELHVEPKDYPLMQVGMEATGHYWLSVYATLQAQGIPISVLNPLEVSAFRQEGIRGSKTDAIDALKIAKLIRFSHYPVTILASQTLIELKQLIRLRQNLMGILIPLKQQLITVMDTLFPEYQSLFKDFFSKTSLSLLELAHTPEALAQLPVTTLAATIKQASRGRLGNKEAVKVKIAAKETIGFKIGVNAFALSIEILLAQMKQLQTQIDQLEKVIILLAKEVKTNLTSIPGVGPITNAIILAEIGDFNRFICKDGAEKLVAYAGIDPKLRESGLWQGKAKMSKRGSSILRHAIRQAAFSAVMTAKDPMFVKIFTKHKAKGKHMEVALSHVSRKLIHVIYSLLKSGKDYQLKTN